MFYHSSQIYRNDHIQGLENEQLCPELFESWGAAFASMLPAKSKFAVACDHRKNSDVYKKALIRGLTDRDIRVFDLGVTPYDLVSYGCQRVEAAGMACVGAGARSASWNGLRWKLIDSPLSYPEQVQTLRYEADRRSLPTNGNVAGEIGEIRAVQTLDISHDWISWLQTVWYDVPNAPFRILIDPMHGSWAGLARRALQAVFPQMIFEAIHDEAEDRFGGKTPCSRQMKSIAKVCSEVDLRRADLGFALDADAGCFTVIDNRGIPLSSEETAWFVLHDLLGEALEGEFFLHDVNCSDIILAEGRRLGGKPVTVPRQEGSFVAEMQRTDALIGFASDGEIYFRGTRGNRIVVFAICWFLDFLCRSDKPLSEVRTTFPKFYTTSEIRTPSASLDDVASKLSHALKTGPEQTLEGIRFDGPHGRVNVRSILDYDQLGFHFEASDRKTLHQMVWECSCALDDLDHIGLFLGELFRTESATRFFPE